MDYSHRRSFHIARLWLLCYVIGVMIRQLTRTSSYSSELFNWNVRCNVKIMPKWDLHLVLMALMRPPFASECDNQGETSDDAIPLKWRTMKTVFLLALASARRRSYIHALSVAPGRCVFSRGNTQRQLMVSFLPEPGFLAESQPPSQALQWISIPGIAHLNPSEAERMLCPVRKLKLYLRDSERIWGRGRQRLFIHCDLRFGGRQESSRIPIYETWHVSLMGCLLWVQWWSHNMSWIQDILSHLHSLRDLYAATDTTFLVRIT